MNNNTNNDKSHSSIQQFELDDSIEKIKNETLT